MTTMPMNSPQFSLQRGLVSVISLLFLAVVVLLLLSKSVEMTGSKNLEAQQHVDSIAAQALAESGRAAAIADITQAALGNSNAFATHCAKYTQSSLAVNSPVGSPITMAPGKIQYIGASVAPSTYQCPIRVKGTVGTANRTLEVWVNFNPANGTAGYGTDISMTLSNPYSTPAIGFFNLAWRRLGSTGQNPPGGQADASCVPPALPATCGTLWNGESSSGTPSVGGYASQVIGVAVNDSVTVHQALTEDRNFAEVGLYLGSMTSSSPTYINSYSDKQDTNNTSGSNPTYGKTTSGAQSGGWCQDADTLVLGVSGRADDNTAASYTNVWFNTSGTPAQPISMVQAAHYSGNAGDVFAEVWFTTNPTLKAANSATATMPLIASAVADAVSGTLNLASQIDLTVGTIIKTYSGNDQLLGSSKVTSCVPANCKSTQQIKISTAISSTLATKLTSNQPKICGGICALFDSPSSTTQKTQFSLTPSNTAARQWSSGFACYSGVDPNKIVAVTKSKVTVDRWHEVMSSE